MRLRLKMLPTDESENASETVPFGFVSDSACLKLNHKMISYACIRAHSLFDVSLHHSRWIRLIDSALNTILDATVLVAIAVQLIVMLSVMMMAQVAVARHVRIPLRTQMMMVNMCRIRNGWTRRVNAVRRAASGLHVTVVLVVIKDHVAKAARIVVVVGG